MPAKKNLACVSKPPFLWNCISRKCLYVIKWACCVPVHSSFSTYLLAHSNITVYLLVHVIKNLRNIGLWFFVIQISAKMSNFCVVRQHRIYFDWILPLMICLMLYDYKMRIFKLIDWKRRSVKAQIDLVVWCTLKLKYTWVCPICRMHVHLDPKSIFYIFKQQKYLLHF